MVSFTFLAGGYDTFIATYLFNPANASLTVSGRFEGGTLNCSWIGGHPTNNSVLYAVNQISPGLIRSFTTTPDGVIAGPFDTAPSGGDRPPHLLALSTGEVGVVNYDTGQGRFVPTASPLTFAIKTTPTIIFPAPEGGLSHPHMVFEHGPDEILVPDKGSDTVWRLRKSKNDEMWKLSGNIVQPLGSGPRHIAVHGDRLFTLHELASTLTLQTFPKLAFNSSTPFIANLSTIPDNPPPGSEWAAAEILMPRATKLFPKTYIYVSNRNIATDPSALDPRGDTIAIFEHVGKGTKNEGLRLVKQVFTGLNQIRGMLIGLEENGSERYLAAAGVAGSGGTVVLERIDGGADLKVVARNTEISQRSTFLWLK
ncbi:putative isomerase YbhE [Marasmius fiardii PR-910]|nr:putative isomerase YbhE [Marasmius fiardii PR-910]